MLFGRKIVIYENMFKLIVTDLTHLSHVSSMQGCVLVIS